MNNKLLSIAIKAALEAGKEILKIYEREDFSFEIKEDKSPLTEADMASNKVINKHLLPTSIEIISEENKQADFSKRKTWDTCWIVDPLDGTKEFIKQNGEFTVNIALVKNGKPKLGVIYVPVTNELYYADVDRNEAFKAVIETNEDDIIERSKPIKPENESNIIKVVGSRSHMSQETLDFVENLKLKHPKKEIKIVSKGSSLKFCLVAEGHASVYPRYAPTMEWDTAAGQAICEAVGVSVTTHKTNKALLYNKENLLNPWFLVSKKL